MCADPGVPSELHRPRRQSDCRVSLRRGVGCPSGRNVYLLTISRRQTPPAVKSAVTDTDKGVWSSWACGRSRPSPTLRPARRSACLVHQCLTGLQCILVCGHAVICGRALRRRCFSPSCHFVCGFGEGQMRPLRRVSRCVS